MTLKFSLNQEDFLKYQLFTAKKSENISKQKRRSYIFIFVAILFFGINIYNKTEPGILYFVPASIAFLILFYFLQKWQYKSHYKNFIEENYKERIGLETVYFFNNDELIIKNSIAESKINYSSFKQIDEIKDYYFLKLKTEESFIIPKREIHDREKFEQIIGFLKTKYNVDKFVHIKYNG